MKERTEIIKSLSEKQKNEIALLLEDCEKKDNRKIDFFTEQEWNEIPDCPCFFLAYEGEQLICAVSVFLAGGEAELSAVTRFEKRRRGIFTKVLRKVFGILEPYGIEAVIFRIDAENREAKQILEHWKAKKIQTDCLMALMPEEEKSFHNRKEEMEDGNGGENNRTERISEQIKCLNQTELIKKKRVLAELHASAFQSAAEDSEWIFDSSLAEGMQLWEYQADNRTIGMCFVLDSKREYFLSAVSIDKAKQHKGYGCRFLTLLLKQLWDKEKKTVCVQVAGENTAAIGLYEKLGFSMQQQLTGYLVKGK